MMPVFNPETVCALFSLLISSLLLWSLITAISLCQYHVLIHVNELMDTDDYLSQECNQNFLNCISRVRESGKGSFKGNKCMVEEVVDVISLVMEAALLAGRVLHKP